MHRHVLNLAPWHIDGCTVNLPPAHAHLEDAYSLGIHMTCKPCGCHDIGNAHLEDVILYGACQLCGLDTLFLSGNNEPACVSVCTDAQHRRLMCGGAWN